MNLLKNKGFTLIELLVVIVIIGILATLAFGKIADYNRKPLPSRYEFRQEVAISIDGSVRMGYVSGAVKDNDVIINEVKVND